MFSYGRQHITAEDIDAVVEVLSSSYLTQGPATERFESALASYCGASYCASVNSATSALHLACLALGVGPGDYVWTSPISFVASANCALYCGASIDFVDINENTYNLCPDRLEEKLSIAKANGKLPKVVIPVHFGGLPCDLKKIRELADSYGFHIIEDAAHGIGASYFNSKIGDCRYSDITVFSFHPVKVITSAEGGAITTTSEKLFKKVLELRSHGITRDPGKLIHDASPWYYEQQNLGFNYRMSDIHAALGESQLKRLDSYVNSRNELANLYNAQFDSSVISTQFVDTGYKSAYHLFSIKLTTIPDKRKYVFQKLKEAGVGVNVHYIPIHLQPYFRKLGFKKGDFPVAEAYYNSCITLPLHPQLSKEDQSRVCRYLKDAINEAAL
ncbi:UDP-4-amino-4,6-dideoxy-N-acetyl-beta-L-altrosamine transaminase [Marinobacterium jannaschii]|uniref:UDP-4-amino-4, 6-dideoxy-N-acetyl-beta-L-altrosamine transaminase n=1 Tax=Marinobacterium jannaschii TaxID=64970 RepID=UPI0004832966|nr:UDP-4-amino-4,6-dideoxy-N-acetyl-beta-L-altrosamine transaminase [Marinobacterium jannaschii]